MEVSVTYVGTAFTALENAVAGKERLGSFLTAVARSLALISERLVKGWVPDVSDPEFPAKWYVIADDDRSWFHVAKLPEDTYFVIVVSHPDGERVISLQGSSSEDGLLWEIEKVDSPELPAEDPATR